MIKKPFILIGFLLVGLLLGCSSREARDSKKTYLDEIKHVKKKDISFMGLFFTKPVSNFYAEKTVSPHAIFINLENVDVSNVKLPKKVKDTAIKSIQTKNVTTAGNQYGQVWLQLQKDVDFTTHKTEYGLRVDFRPTGRPLEAIVAESPPEELSTPEEKELSTAKKAEEMRLETQDEELSEQEETEAETGAPKIDDGLFSTPNAPSISTPPSVQEPSEDNTKRLEDIARIKDNGSERITLTGSEALDYQQTILDRQVVIELKDTVASDAVFALEINEPESYLLSVDTFTSKKPYVSTKVTLNFNESITPTITSSGNQININFDQPKVAKLLTDKKASKIDFGNYLHSPSPLPGRKISIQTKDAQIHDVLKMLSQASDYNILAGRDVKGKLTLRLIRVPWDQAFIAILQAYQLGYVKQGNILRVSTLGSLYHEKDVVYKALAAKQKLQPLNVMFIPISHRIASTLTKHVYPLLSEMGSLSIDRPTNTIIIRDTAQVLENMKKFIASIDKKTQQK